MVLLYHIGTNPITPNLQKKAIASFYSKYIERGNFSNCNINGSVSGANLSDSFTVPAGEIWIINNVEITYSAGSSAASSFADIIVSGLPIIVGSSASNNYIMQIFVSLALGGTQTDRKNFVPGLILIPGNILKITIGDASGNVVWYNIQITKKEI